MNRNHLTKLQQILTRIPKGNITTYKEIAHAMGMRGYRYVGQLLSKNSEPDIYPCYKVVMSNGNLGGFALGCADKIRRLKKDGVDIRNGKVVNFTKHLYKFNI